MKKLISVLLVLAVCLSVLPAAFALDSITSWSEGESIAAQKGLNGSFVTLNGVGLKMWVPDSMKPRDLAADIVNEYGYIAYYVNEGSSFDVGVTVAELNVSLEELVTYLKETGTSITDQGKINGISVVCYENVRSDGSVCDVVTTVVSNGRVVEFAFAAGNSEMREVASIMASSIQHA